MTHEKVLETIYCPYCDAVNTITTTETSLIFPYPTINPPGKFLGSINYSLVPAGTQEKAFSCTRCGNIFSILLFQQNPENPIYDYDVKNYVDSILERKQIEEKIPLFEKFLKWYFENFDIFEIKSRLFGAYILVLAPLIFFLVFQYLMLGNLSVTFNDYPFLVFFLLFGFSVYLFGLYIEQYHFSLNAKKLPLLLSESYKKSPYFKVFEEWRIHFFNYAYHKIPFTKYSISHPTYIGLLGSGFYFSIMVIFFYIHKPIVQSGFSQYDLILSIGYLPFWIVFTFFFGYASTMFLHTSTFLVQLSENTPLEFNPLKKNGGFDSLMKFSGLIILQISILGSLILILLYDLWRMNILQVDTAAMTKEPWGIVLGLILIVLITWFFIVPLITLTKRYQQLKYEYLEKIRIQIESLKMCSYYENQKEDSSLLRYNFDKANSLPDWPFPIQINIVISLVISLISLFVAIVKIFTS